MSFTHLPNYLRFSPPSVSRRKIAAARHFSCPMLETLEQRRMFSTWTVTSNQDSGAGSLRAEIAAAQSGDTIVFADVLSSSSSKPHGHGTTTSTPGTITLTSGELAHTKNLTIQGPGAGKLIISGTSPAPIQHGQKPS